MAKTAKFDAEYDLIEGEESSSLSSGTAKKLKLASSEAFLVQEKKNGVKNGVTRLSFKKFRALCMAKRVKKQFKDPTIVRCKTGDWYAQYHFLDPNDQTTWLPKKERCGINYIKDLSEKEKEAELLRKDVLEWLNEGNSPFDEDPEFDAQLIRKESQVEKIIKSETIWTLKRAIEEYDKKVAGQGHTDDTIRTYQKYTRAFHRWLSENELLYQKACLFTEMDAQVYLEEMFEEKEWSGRTFNNYLEHMITFFTAVRKLEKKETKNRNLKYDFDPEELEPKISKPQRNKAFTPMQVDKIKQQCKAEGFADTRDYFEWIFLSSMRPKEIRALKMQDIDHINRTIRIVGKTGDRLIPIGDQLLNLIKKRGIMTKALKTYVFGWAGAVDDRRMSVAYFLDKFNTIADTIGLGENYGPYSFKPTGIIKMIMEGFTDKQIMELTGHKTESAFAKYKRDLVIENSHVMKGGTIDF